MQNQDIDVLDIIVKHQLILMISEHTSIEFQKSFRSV